MPAWSAGLSIAAAVLKASAANIGPEARAAFDAGEKLGFGPVHVSESGIQLKRKWYPWAAVTSLRFADGKLSVNDDQKPFLRTFVPVRKIPNALVLADLVADRLDETPSITRLVNAVRTT